MPDEKYSVKQEIGYVEQGAVVKGVENNVQIYTQSLTINVEGDLNFSSDIAEILSPEINLSSDKLKIKALLQDDLNTAFKAAKEKPNIKFLGRLPRLYHGFLDRKDEYSSILKALSESPKAVLLITGIGGIGKTWLVTKVLKTLIQGSNQGDISSNRFEKIYYLRCEDNNLSFEKLFIELSELVGRKSEAVELIKRRDTNLQDKIDFLLQLLCSFKLLIVLDSFEKIIDSSCSIPQSQDDLDSFLGYLILEEHCSKLLIVSRYIPVRLGNSRISHWDHLPLSSGLPENDAIELLKNNAIPINDEELHKIVDKTYGIPRALESVGALVCEGNWDALDSYSQVFKEKVVEDFINLQISSLDDWEKNILTSTALFRIPFTKESLLWISEFEPGRTEQSINSIYIKRLFEVNNEHEFMLHPLVRDVLLAHIDDEAYRKVNSKIAQMYSLTNWNEKPLNLEQLSNQIEAHYHFFEAKEFNKAGIIATKLASYLRGLGYYDYLEKILSDTINTCDGVLEAMARHGLAGLAFSRGLLKEAESQWLQALQIFEIEKNPVGMCHTYHSLGRVCQTRSDYSEALAWYDRSIKMSLDNDNYLQAGISQHQVAYIHFLIGDYDQALHSSKICLSYREAGNHKKGTAISLHLLGMIKEIQGNYHEAEIDYRTSLEIEQSYGVKNRIAICKRSIGNICLTLGRLGEAITLFTDSYRIVNELGAKLSEAECLDCIATFYLVNENIEEAEKHYLLAYEIRQNVGFPLGTAQSLRHLGRIFIEKGDYQVARSYLEQSQEIAQKLKTKLTLIDIWLDYGKLEVACGNFSQVKVFADQALSLSNEIGYRAGTGLANLLLADYAIALKDHSGAQALLRSSLELFALLERKMDIDKVQQLISSLEVSDS